MPRISPLPPKEWPKEYRAAMAALRPPNPRHQNLSTENRPKGLNVLGTMAHHPALAQAYFTFNGHVLLATTLTERQRELIIMRVAAVRKSGYEWAQHLFVARDVGLTDEEIGRIGYGPDAPFWSELDAAMLRAVDELVEDACISQPTWEDAGCRPRHSAGARLDLHRQRLRHIGSDLQLTRTGRRRRHRRTHG